MLAPSGSRTGRETAKGALGRRVQAYGGDRRVPHVRGHRDLAVVAGQLPIPDPGRFNEMTQFYGAMQTPHWEATKRAYVKVTARPARG